jgi:hypothetical protein
MHELPFRLLKSLVQRLELGLQRLELGLQRIQLRLKPLTIPTGGRTRTVHGDQIL